MCFKTDELTVELVSIVENDASKVDYIHSSKGKIQKKICGTLPCCALGAHITPPPPLF